MYSIRGDTVLDGRYQLERRLGQGGMGIVYKARHIFLKAPYAIKVILPDLVGNDPLLVTRFRQEAMLAARIRHRNIVNVTDFGVANGTMPYLVMDFIRGRSLQDVLGEVGRFSPQRALEVMSAVCAGVGAAHQQGVVHRDLKPLNIMVQDNETLSEGVKVLDFGLAKIKSGELLGSFVAAQSTGLMGSPFYMAPELWSDEEPDKSVDIYSMGVILFQILAGDVPFNGNSIPSIMKKHLSDPPPSFMNFGVNIPSAIEAVVRHALAKKPNARPSSVDEFLNELRAGVATASLSISRPVMDQEGRGADTQLNFNSGSTNDIGRPSWQETLTKSQRGIEDEADRLRLEFEEAQLRADEARKRAEEAAVRRAEEEAARRRAEEEAAHKQAEEEAARKRAEEAVRRQIEEEAALKLAEQQAALLRAEEAARKIAEEEAERIRVAEEAKRLAREVTEAQERAAEARFRADEEARKRTEEAVARQRAEEDARRLAQEVANAERRAEEARQRAEQEARIRADDEAARKSAEEQTARQLAEEAARRQAVEESARRQAAEDADRLGREVAEALRRAEEAGQRAEAEAQKRLQEEEARKRAEEEARWLQQEMVEVQRRAEEARQRVEAESRERAEEEALKRAEAEEARMRAEEESRRLMQEMAAARSQEMRELAARRQSAISAAATSDPRTGQQSGSGYAQAAGDHGLAGAGIESGAVSAGQTRRSIGEPSFGGGSGTKPKTAVWIILGVLLVVGVISIGGAGAFYAFYGRVAKPITSTKPTNGTSPAPTPAASNMVKVDGGTFQMGRNDVALNSAETYDYGQYPAHIVDVKTFWMDKTEVTIAEYAAFLTATKHPAPSYWINGKPPADQMQWPVTNVSLEDAKAFAKWRSKRDNVEYRLPKEEEWEYAARNGAQATLYPWGNQFIAGRANVDGNSPKPVGSYPEGASRIGILDLIGNVWELTDTKAAPYPGGKPIDNIQGKFVIRGGGYSEPGTGINQITASRRSFVSPSDKAPEMGFRLVRDAP